MSDTSKAQIVRSFHDGINQYMTALGIKVGTATSFLVSQPRRWRDRAQLTPIKEFDFQLHTDGRSASARYANNSNYRNDSLIRKESRCDPTSGDIPMLKRPQ